MVRSDAALRHPEQGAVERVCEALFVFGSVGTRPAGDDAEVSRFGEEVANGQTLTDVLDVI
ncbi:MAG: hypothetical protein JWN04_1349, partial [Myxococcaceae bacterium]|nr:hypothetical protein [Myxococcaceae bacterium]